MTAAKEKDVIARYFRSSWLPSVWMEAVNSLTKIGSITSGKEAAKPDSSIVRILAKIFCTYEPFKVTQEEKRLNLR